MPIAQICAKLLRLRRGADALALPGAVRGILWMLGSTASWSTMAAIARHFTGEIHTFEIEWEHGRPRSFRVNTADRWR